MMDEVSQHSFNAQDKSGPVWEAVWGMALNLKLPADVSKQLADAAQQKACEIYEVRSA